MSAIANPAVEAFSALVKSGPVSFAQARVRAVAEGFEIRHVADAARADIELKAVTIIGLRDLSQDTATGAFRPLKSSPDLVAGWRIQLRNGTELAAALDALYPGALTDWHAAQSPAPPVTDYRPFTERQTGMYRIATFLNDVQAAQVARACCHRDFCLKQRLWTVPGLATDAAAEKSLIPCLEPCALLLEFARKAARLEQEAAKEGSRPPVDRAEVEASLRQALTAPEAGARVADFNEPNNPRRLRLQLEQLSP